MTTDRQPPSSDRIAVIPAICIPQGDGSYLVKTGRPIERLTVLQFARELGISRNSVYRYILEGDIPDRFVQYVGPRRILISAAAVPHVLAQFRRAREA